MEDIKEIIDRQLGYSLDEVVLNNLVDKIINSIKDISISKDGKDFELYLGGWYVCNINRENLTPEALEQVKLINKESIEK